MSYILCISGSSREESSNIYFLRKLCTDFRDNAIKYSHIIHDLPLFRSENDNSDIPEIVSEWRSLVVQSSAMIISTPEYLHNLPASIKNALEWLTTTGELNEKKVLPITLTPHHPRGENAMKALLWSLQALNADIVAQLPSYKNELYTDDDAFNPDLHEIIKEALLLI